MIPINSSLTKFSCVRGWHRILVSDRETLPMVPGVYLFQRGREILYVGTTTQCLHTRICSGHFNNSKDAKGRFLKPSDTIVYSPSLKFGEELMREARLIRRLRPTLNKAGKAEDFDIGFYMHLESLHRERVQDRLSRETRWLSQQEIRRRMISEFPEYGDVSVGKISELVRNNPWISECRTRG